MKEVVDQSEESPSDRPRTDEGPGANDLIPDQLQSHLSLKNDPESVPAPSIQDTDMSGIMYLCFTVIIDYTNQTT